MTVDDDQRSGANVKVGSGARGFETHPLPHQPSDRSACSSEPKTGAGSSVGTDQEVIVGACIGKAVRRSGWRHDPRARPPLFFRALVVADAQMGAFGHRARSMRGRLETQALLLIPGRYRAKLRRGQAPTRSSSLRTDDRQQPAEAERCRRRARLAQRGERGALRRATGSR